MIVQELDVGALDLRPHRLVLAGARKALRDRGHRLLHARVVEVDALAARRAHRRPVRALETILGRPGHRAKDPVVSVESLEDRPGDVASEFHSIS